MPLQQTMVTEMEPLSQGMCPWTDTIPSESPRSLVHWPGQLYIRGSQSGVWGCSRRSPAKLDNNNSIKITLITLTPVYTWDIKKNCPSTSSPHNALWAFRSTTFVGPWHENILQIGNITVQALCILIQGTAICRVLSQVLLRWRNCRCVLCKEQSQLPCRWW